MTLTVATNSRNDIYLDSRGNIAMTHDIDAVENACKNAALAQLGEMIYAVNSGLPNFQAIWKGTPNYPLWIAYLRRTLAAVPGVNRVESVLVRQSGDVMSYTAVIITNFGTRQFNGEL
jgi:hypothetical protein